MPTLIHCKNGGHPVRPWQGGVIGGWGARRHGRPTPHPHFFPNTFWKNCACAMLATNWFDFFLKPCPSSMART